MRYLLSIFILLALMAIGNYSALTFGFVWTPAQSLVAVGFLILIAYSFGEVFRKIGLPALLGYITVGIVFGPSFAEQLPFDFPTAIITAQVIDDMHIVNVLVVGVIGMLAGGKFRIGELAGNLRLLLVLTASILVLVVSLTVIGVLSLAQIFPTQLAFIHELPMSTQILVALFFGVLAFGLSSSTTVALIQELRARGPLSTVVLGVVLLSEVVLFALFALLIAVGRYMATSEALTLVNIASHVPNVLVDLALAILIGIGVGIISVLYLTYVKKEALLFTLVLIFAGYYGATQLGVEALLVFLAAGFFVQNASARGDEMVRALERIGMPIFVVYFALVAAQLDLKVAAGYLPLVLGLVIIRVFALHFATRMASRRAVETNRAYEYLHISFFSQDAVVLVLAGVVANTFPVWGAAFQNVTMATVIAYLIGGPILFKLALDRAGETQFARQRLIDEMDYRADDSDAGVAALSLQAQLPDPDFADAWLRGAVQDLQESLITLDDRWIRTPIIQQSTALSSFLNETHTLITSIVTRLHEQAAPTPLETNFADSDQPNNGQNITKQTNDALLEQLAEAVREGQKRFTNRLHPLLESILQKDNQTLTATDMESFMEGLRDLEDQQSILKVEREDELFDSETGDGRIVKFVKRIRRLRYRLRGPGYRSVPIGRLWRYYVELAVPVSFSSDTATITIQRELFWRQLWLHLRTLDALFDDLHNAINSRLSLDHPEDDKPLTPAVVDNTDSSDEKDIWFKGRQSVWLDTTTQPPEALATAEPDLTSELDTNLVEVLPITAPMVLQQKRFLEIIEQFESDEAKRHKELSEILQRSAEIALHRYSHSIAQAYEAFLVATAHAGTSELLPFRYRPGARYDQASRAETRLLERLQRLHKVIDGYHGWILLDHETALLAQWFQLYKMRVQRVTKSLVEARAERDLAQIISRCETLAKTDNEPENTRDWTALFQSQIQPLLQQHRRSVENALAQFHQGLSTRALIDIVEARISHLPEHIVVLAQEADRSTIASSSFDLAFRHWVVTQLDRELVLRFVEFNERGSTLLTGHLKRLENAAQVLEFNLLTAQRTDHVTVDPADIEGADNEASESDNFAINGLNRARKLIEQAQIQLLDEAQNLNLWIQSEIDVILNATFKPLHERRLGEVQRELARLEAASLMQRGETLASEYLRPLMGRLRTGTRRFGTYWQELAQDLRSVLGQPPLIADRSDIRAILYAGQPAVASLAPPIYRRLFTPVPLDILDFYVARPDVEHTCIQAINGWLEGQSNSILITGSRGMGKRTLVHNIVPARVHAQSSSQSTTQKLADQIATRSIGKLTSLQNYNDPSANKLIRRAFNTPQELTEDQYVTIRLSEQTRDENDLCRQLCVLIGTKADGTVTDMETFTQLLTERAGPRRIVILENADKIYSRTSSGLAMARKFLTMLSQTSHNTLWIVIMNTPASSVLQSMVGLKDFFTHSLHVEPLDHDEIEHMIMTRHQVSGFSLDFLPRQLNRLQRLRRPFLGKTVRQPPGEFFERLTRRTHGNPHLALLYWLRAVELDPQDDSSIHVMPLEYVEFNLLDELSLTKKLILALLAQHGSLTPHQLHTMLREPIEITLTELDHLKRLGFVEILAETLENYRLRALAAPLVAHELRRNNLI